MAAGSDPHKGHHLQRFEARSLPPSLAQKGCRPGGDRPYSRVMRRAFTLPEIVLVLAVAGILLGIAVPPVYRTLDRIEVEAAVRHLVTAHQRARIMAITRSQVVVLTLQPTELTIHRPGEDAPLWSEPGPAASGVSLIGPARQFTFSPEGLTLGLSNATLQLTRGLTSRTVVISRLGRVRVR